jgi:hypothetical protein
VTEFSDFFSAGTSATAIPARALLWEQTLHQVLLLLDMAERRIRSPEGQLHYTNLDGWWRSSKARVDGKTLSIPSEEAISEALFEEMEKVKAEIILKIIPSDANLDNLDTLQFAPETPRRVKTGIGKRAKPTDIRVYRTGSQILDLRIEAKVLVKDGDIAKSYLSKSGLKRFSDPKEPYTDHELGGMIAYTVSDDRATWLQKIDSALKTAKPPVPTFKHLVRTLPHETLFCRVPFTAVSSPARNEVLVFHLVLEFDSSPTAR